MIIAWSEEDKDYLLETFNTAREVGLDSEFILLYREHRLNKLSIHEAVTETALSLELENY